MNQLDAVERALDAALGECSRQGCPDQVLQEARTAGLLAAKTALGIPASDAYSGTWPEPAKPVKIRLTKAQRAELMRQRFIGPQHTYGKGRARIQNNLYRMKLSEFLDYEGRPTSPWIGNLPHRCVITDAGRRTLEEE